MKTHSKHFFGTIKQDVLIQYIQKNVCSIVHCTNVGADVNQEDPQTGETCLFQISKVRKNPDGMETIFLLHRRPMEDAYKTYKDRIEQAKRQLILKQAQEAMQNIQLQEQCMCEACQEARTQQEKQTSEHSEQREGSSVVID